MSLNLIFQNETEATRPLRERGFPQLREPGISTELSKPALTPQAVELQRPAQRLPQSVDIYIADSKPLCVRRPYAAIEGVQNKFQLRKKM